MSEACARVSAAGLLAGQPNVEIVRSDRRLVVVISGPVGGGKSTLANSLEVTLGATVTRTRPILEQQYFLDPHLPLRAHLQRLGETLDEETNGRWVADAAARDVRYLRHRVPLVVDAVRHEFQIERLREQLAARIFHVHVTASRRVLERRYEEARAQNPETELPSVAELRESKTEASVGDLAAIADLRLNTGRWPKVVNRWRVRKSILMRRLLAGCALGGGIVCGLLLILAVLVAVVVPPRLMLDNLSSRMVFGVDAVVVVIAFLVVAGTGLGSASPIPNARRRSSRVWSARMTRASQASSTPPERSGERS